VPALTAGTPSKERNLTTTVYETSTLGGNVSPRHNAAALAVREPEPRDEANNQRGNSGNGPDTGGGKQSSQRNGRPEPKPDALWHTPNREAWATIGGRHYQVASSDFRHWLTGQFYECNGEAASGYKLDELVGAYAAEALFKSANFGVSDRRFRFKLAGGFG
jgi:hypothetical protein